MNLNQLEHRSEQMDAARVEFRRLFGEIVRASETIFKMPIDDYIQVELACWQMFLVTKGLKK